MLTEKRVLFMFTETSLHAGTGAHLGAVDLPIQRERHTGYPIVQGSGVKGAMRAAAREKWTGDGARREEEGPDAQKLYAVFGPPTDSASDHGGAVAVTDARVLLLPVRAPGCHYAWVTCPDLLARLRRDISGTAGAPEKVPAVPNDRALVAHNSVLQQEGVVLEEFYYRAQVSEEVASWAKWLARHALPEYPEFRQRLETHLVVLSNPDFQDLSLTATEVVTRVKLDASTKTVAQGALWTEEALPADTLLFSVVHAGPPTRQGTTWADVNAMLNDLAAIIGPTIQVGGDETTGRGWVSLRWHGGAA